MDIVACLLLKNRREYLSRKAITREFVLAHKALYPTQHIEQISDAEIEYNIDAALKLMSFSFLGVVQMNKQDEFEYDVSKIDSYKAYTRDFRVMAQIRDRFLLIKKDIFVRSLIDTALFPALYVERKSLSKSEAEKSTAFLLNMFSHAKFVKKRFGEITRADCYQRVNQMNEKGLKIANNGIEIGPDSS